MFISMQQYQDTRIYFQECQPILMHMKKPTTPQISKIFGIIEDQLDIIEFLIEIEGIRKNMKQTLIQYNILKFIYPTWGKECQGSSFIIVNTDLATKVCLNVIL